MVVRTPSTGGAVSVHFPKIVSVDLKNICIEKADLLCV